MTTHSKSSETWEKRLRARTAYSWWMPILWGMVISVSLGMVVIAIVLLDREGLIPSWVFGWISSDRETQKRQFRLTLYALFAFFLITRLVKRGLFGETARTTYNGMYSRPKMSQGEPDEEIHARICAVRNVRSAVFLLGVCMLEVFLSWRALGTPFVEHNLYDLFFRIALSILVFPALWKISKCVPERFILVIVMIRFVTGWVFEYAPNLVDPFAGLIRQCNLVLSILAFLTSLAMLVSLLSRPRSA